MQRTFLTLLFLSGLIASIHGQRPKGSWLATTEMRVKKDSGKSQLQRDPSKFYVADPDTSIVAKYMVLDFINRKQVVLHEIWGKTDTCSAKLCRSKGRINTENCEWTYRLNDDTLVVITNEDSIRLTTMEFVRMPESNLPKHYLTKDFLRETDWKFEHPLGSSEACTTHLFFVDDEFALSSTICQEWARTENGEYTVDTHNGHLFIGKLWACSFDVMVLHLHSLDNETLKGTVLFDHLGSRQDLKEKVEVHVSALPDQQKKEDIIKSLSGSWTPDEMPVEFGLNGVDDTTLDEYTLTLNSSMIYEIQKAGNAKGKHGENIIRHTETGKWELGGNGVYIRLKTERGLPRNFITVQELESGEYVLFNEAYLGPDHFRQIRNVKMKKIVP